MIDQWQMKDDYLQRLATNEIRPPANLSWNTFLTG
jgi:hypothetical protein